MKYLKVFTDFVEDMKELGEAERGRLFTAMLTYAETGTETALRGNERFVWGTAKKSIDGQRKAYEHICEVNRENGSEPKRIASKKANGSESLQEKEKEKEKEKNKRNLSKGERRKKNSALQYEQKPISKSDFDALVVDLGEA